jgi:hypothetical protein
MTVICALCDNLHEHLIITLPVADKLYRLNEMQLDHLNDDEYESIVTSSDEVETDGCCAVVTRVQS